MRLARFGDLRLLVPPGVYAPRSDTALLAGELGDVRGAAVLELCAGSGAVVLSAARAGAARCVAVDRSARAVLAIRANARLNGLRVDARRGDLTGALAAGERFDVIVANPPYLPAVGLDGPPDARWDAGPDGRAVVDRIVDAATAHLRPGGRLVVVQSNLTGTETTVQRLDARGLEVVARLDHHGPLGPISAARRAALVASGTLDPDAATGAEEVLTVLTARPRAAVAA